jgi:hypothetical protein
LFVVPLIFLEFLLSAPMPDESTARAPAQLISLEGILVSNRGRGLTLSGLWQHASQAVFHGRQLQDGKVMSMGNPDFRILTLDRVAGMNLKALQIQDQVLHIFSSRLSSAR